MTSWQKFQKDPYYNIRIDFPQRLYWREPNALEIRVDYQVQGTEEDVITFSLKRQMRLSKVLYMKQIIFVTNDNQLIYQGLIAVHAHAPYVLLKTIQSLEQYKTEVSLNDMQEKTVNHTISELEKIINRRTKERL